MSKYPFNHSEEGNLIYKVENYKFRYRGIAAADITLLEVPGEQFGYEFEIYQNNEFWSDLPYKFRKSSSNSIEIRKALNIEMDSGFFDEKEEALKSAIHMVEELLDKYYNQRSF